MLIRLLSFFVALILFISSSGLLIQSHFCQNQLQSISLFLKPESCHKNVSHHCKSATKKCCKVKPVQENNNCCHNIADFVKLDLDQYFFKYHLNDKVVDFVKILKYYNQLIPHSFVQKKIKFFNYKPPLIDFDLQTHFQIFLC